MKARRVLFLVWCAWFSGALCGLAEDGSADLNKAIVLNGQATTLGQLQEVADLCEQAIAKGLSPDDEAFAVQLLTGALYGRVEPQVRRLLPNSPELLQGLQQRRAEMLADLRKIIKYDDQFGQAHLMIAQLEALPGGDRKAARRAVERAIELMADDRSMLVKGLLLRGQLQETEEARLADFDRAVEVFPEDPTVWQTRALYYLQQGKVDKAIADFKSLLEKDEDNLLAHLAIADSLLKAEKIDEAMEHVNRIVEERPNVVALKLRAQLWMMQEKADKAIQDVNEALAINDNDLELYLMRSQLYHFEERHALAKDDVDRVLQERPDDPRALELRSSILVALGKIDEAIADINELLVNNPESLIHNLQLALYLNAAGKEREAIEVYTKVLKSEPGNGAAMRGRADAYLNLGEHRDAIADYEAALKVSSEDSGMLNNFAWVLATSPHDNLRNGKRAIELARQACELTEFKQAHILSTLAAAYAETGDFEQAIKWSKKSCELGDESIQEHLQKELASYQQGRPWREDKGEEKAEEQAAAADDDHDADRQDERPAAEENVAPGKAGK